MNLDTAIRLTAQVQGANNIRGLAQQFQQLSGASQVSGRQLDRLYTETKKLSAAAGGSINSLRQQRTALLTIRDALEPTSRRFQMLTRDVEALDQHLKRLNGTQRETANTQRGIGRQVVGSALGTLATGGGLQGAAGALAGGLAFSGGVGGALAGAGITAVAAGGALAARVGVQAERAEVRLRALTDQFGEFNQAQLAATRIAGTLRISQIEAADGLSQLYAALRPTGVTLREIEDAFIGFTAAARVSGATATESSAALLQLRQALGSGVLQGDELRSLREQAPLAAQAIAREMGVTIGELKALGSEGKITTDIVLRALATLKNENLGKLNQQFNTSAQALADMRVALDEFGVSLSRIFGPAGLAIVKGFTDSLRETKALLDFIAQGPEGAARNAIRAGRMPLTAAAFGGTSAVENIFKGSSGVGGVGFTGLREEAIELARIRRQPVRTVLAELMRNRLERIENRPSNLTQEQRDAQADAARQRAAGRERAMQAEGEKARKKADTDREDALKRQFDLETRLGDIRLQTEKRLAEFREQSLRRAQQLEQDIRDQREQADRRMDRLTSNLRGQEEDRALRAEIQRAREAGMPTEGLELRLSAQQEMRRVITDVDDINNSLQDNYKTLNRSIKQLATDYSEGLRDVVQQGAEATTDALRDAQRQVTGASGGSSSGITGLLQAASSKLGLFAGQTERCADAIRELFKTAGIAIGVTKKAWDGLASGPRLASSFFGSDIGQRINRQQDLRPGDLVGFERTYGSWGRGVQTHVGMYAGNGMMFDHSSRAGLVRRPLNTFAGKFMYGVRPYALMGEMPPGATATAPAPQLRPQDLVAPNQAQVTAAARGLMDLQGRSARVEGVSILGGLLDNRIVNFSENTKELTDQANATRQQLENYQRQQVLIRGGLSPEISKMRVEAERKLETERNYLQVLEQVVIDEMRSKELTDSQKKGYEDLLTRIRDRLGNQLAIVDGMVKEQQQLDRLTQAYEEKRQLVEGIAGSIGEGIAGSIDLLINGTENWGASLREIAAGVLQDIAQQLAQVMVVRPVVASLTQAFGFANGGIMSADGPLPLRAYSAGGIANSPQLALFGEGRRPEAFVPLPDGRRIPVALQGGSQGGSVVNVTVNAQGSAVQGNDNRSERLGRVVAQAIQEEMIRQRRPGGLLSAV